MSENEPRAGARMRRVVGGAGGATVLAALGVAIWLSANGTPDPVRGAAIYAENCAACHGADLKGARNWQSRGDDGRLPPPPQDRTGHTWHHADQVLFRLVKEGPGAVIGDGYESDMPGFGDTLDDSEIRDALEYIKSSWPERERAYQIEMTRREEAR